jgi:hypothetical protein
MRKEGNKGKRDDWKGNKKTGRDGKGKKKGPHEVGAKGCRVQGQAKWGGEAKDGRMDVRRGLMAEEGKAGEGKCRLRQIGKAEGEMMGKGREGLEETEEEW